MFVLRYVQIMKVAIHAPVMLATTWQMIHINVMVNTQIIDINKSVQFYDHYFSLQILMSVQMELMDVPLTALTPMDRILVVVT